jgi:hypothetical protein
MQLVIVMINFWGVVSTMKTKLIELELMKQLLHKKLAKIENEINLLKGENTYEQELKGFKGIFSTSKGM